MLRWLRPLKRFEKPSLLKTKSFEKPSLKSRWVKLHRAGLGGAWQQKPPLHLICLRFGLSAGISDIGGNGC